MTTDNIFISKVDVIQFINAMPNPVSICRDGIPLLINPVYSNLLGENSADSLPFKDFFSAHYPQNIINSLKNRHDMILKGTTVDNPFRVRAIRRDQTEILLNITETLIPWFDGSAVYHIASDVPSYHGETQYNLDYENLLRGIQHIQSLFIAEKKPEIVFNELLAKLLQFTDSEYGFIGEIKHRNGTPYLKTHAITNIAWNEESRRFYEQNAPTGLEFTNLSTLFGEVIKTGKPVIANNPATDPRSGGLPEGHPPLNHFLGAPIYKGSKLVGMIGISNKLNGYADEDVVFLAPLLSSAGLLIDQYHNIQRRQLYEQSLRISENKFRSLINNAPDIIIVSERNGNLLEANNIAMNLLAVDLDNLRSVSIFDIDTAARSRTKHWGAIQNEYDTVYETEYICRDGSLLPVEVHITVIEAVDGNKVLTIARDITKRKEAELEKEKLIAELETSNAEMERFTYTVSHDLKSPLITIRGFLGHLENDIDAGDKVKITNDLNRISAATDRMKELLDQLLELSRIGRTEYPFEHVNLVKIINDTIEVLSYQIESTNTKIETNNSFQSVYIDRVRIGEVFQNIIENAIKFKRPGLSPMIKIDHAVQKNKVVVFVKDNGIGIAQKYHSKIFDIFDKLDPDSPGTGIGLALVKRIINLHGGEIWVESEGQDTGTAVYFTIPLACESQS